MSSEKTLEERIYQPGELSRELLLEARRLKAVKQDYRDTFLKRASGKRVLTDLMQAAGVVRPLYVPGDNEAWLRADAIREFALGILDQLDIRGFEEIAELEKKGLELVKFGEELFDEKED